jgi:pyruvate dehydrogenase E2 component (dihydrolipoamide acetyltransferase)
MAKIEVVMPQMGESITTGTITKWHKQPGEVIELDAILLEISTDKVESEIPSPVHGKIVQLLFPEGATVDVGRPIAIIEDDLNAKVDAAPASVPKAQVVASSPESGMTAENSGATAVMYPNPPGGEGTLDYAAVHNDAEADQGFRFYTPLVKAMAKDAGIPLAELKNVKGSGAAGRVNKADLEAYIATRGAKPAAAPAPRAAAAPASTTALAGVSETRPSGRVEIVAMDNMRKAIAKNMVISKQTSPHVNSIDEIDMTNLVKQREKLKNEFKKREGINLTYSHFVLYALVQALKEHPLVNASIEGDNIVIKKDIHLGCAVAVPGNGLVVPVIKNAGDLNLTGLARQLDVLAAKARTKKLTMDDLSGGTYTFTNNGSFGTLIATPVILQPQVGIFCTGVIKKRVMVMDDDAIAIRHMMYGTHTYDHRLIDGELGSKFLASVKHHLETMVIESLV